MRKNLINEFASEPAEAHAILHGFFLGLFDQEPKPEYADSVNEPHYFRFGYIIGWIVDDYFDIS